MVQVPYIAEAMANKTGNESREYFDINGILIYDPILGDRKLAENVPIAHFLERNRNL
jgi:hypothetical protein